MRHDASTPQPSLIWLRCPTCGWTGSPAQLAYARSAGLHPAGCPLCDCAVLETVALGQGDSKQDAGLALLALGALCVVVITLALLLWS